MPHVIVKLWPGQSEASKADLSGAILREVTAFLGTSEASVSIGFEEVPAGAWTEKVFRPDILGKWETLTKTPGYGERPLRKCR